MVKIYFTGFNASSPIAKSTVKKYKLVCSKYGCQAIFPATTSEYKRNNDSFCTPLEIAHLVFDENLRRIDNANIVLANLNYSMGFCTNNTAFEIGYAYANHKRIIGYRDVEYALRFYDLHKKFAYQTTPDDSEQPANLMTTCSMSVIVQGELEDCLELLFNNPYEDMKNIYEPTTVDDL